MVHFKSLKQGLTLIETVIALAIFGMIVSSVLIMQQSSFATLLRSSGKLTRIYSLQNFLVDIMKLQKEQKSVPAKKDIKEPPTTLQFEEKKPAKTSALSSFDDVVIRNLKAQWADGKQKRSVSLISLVYKPQKEKSE